MVTARLIDHPAGQGSWNMAVDEALLQAASESAETTLRLYRWSPATLSLGYFQSTQQRGAHAASFNCAMVRRTTGGGAILHDRELTYSLSLPFRDPKSAARLELYQLAHQALIAALGEWNIRATLFSGEESAPRKSAFLCFERRSPGDILLEGFKIGGSAQRREHAAILQHGSLLLARSEYAPELPGVRELSGVEIGDQELSVAFVRHWQRLADWSFRPARLSEREQFASLEIQQKQFERHDWNHRR